MCRNIRTLFNFEPPATELEIRDAALQFVRKLSGFNVPSQANAAAFDHAVAAAAMPAVNSVTASRCGRTPSAQRHRNAKKRAGGGPPAVSGVSG